MLIRSISSRRSVAADLKPRASRLRRAVMMVPAVVFGATVGIGIAALAVDTGLMYASKAELQNAADSAALAAAAQLGSLENATGLAGAEAAIYAQLNKVAGEYADAIETDIVPGHAVLVGENRFEFQPNVHPFDAVRITLRRDPTVSDGPVSLLFGKALGVNDVDIRASATAMLVPRDIAVVIDLSASMNDDSELRHYDDFVSDTGNETRPGVQINLRDIWCALNGPAPNQPYTPGLPTATQYAGDTGPTWGQMTNWGSQIVLGSYNPTTDPGLLYLKKSVNCTDAATQSQLVTRGYKTAASSSPSTMNEVDCLKKGTQDGSYGNNFLNRTKVILGLAQWRSGKSQSKYGHNVGGDGDDKVEDNELTAAVSYPSGMSSGTWNDWITNYVAVSTKMSDTDSNLHYRYGLKTFVNYLLEKQAKNSKTPQLAATPEMPLRSVKDAVQTFVDTIVDLETQDHCSLEIFATTGRHEVDMTNPASGESLAGALQEIPDTLYLRQAGHYDSTTCIGCGLDAGIAELTSDRSRDTAKKVIILMTDGVPNIAPGGASPDDYCISQAAACAEMGITLYTVGVGGALDHDLLQQMADIGQGEYFFADSAPDGNGVPLYVSELQDIFETLGGRRPVRLIQ